MSHVQHIAKNKTFLTARWQILRLLREWFWGEGFTEVETPAILRLPGQEPHLNPVAVDIHNERGEEFSGYLHTSPEYAMKKMLAAGFDKIFSLGKVWRDRESFGGTHNPEFTMLEWYRTEVDYTALMDDVENLVEFVADRCSALGGLKSGIRNSISGIRHLPAPMSETTSGKSERVRMRDLWQRHAGVNLDNYLTREAMWRLCREKGYQPAADEPYEDLFYRIFLNEIEPNLSPRVLTIVHSYPLPMAALSRVSESDPGYAERVEAYLGGLELGNGFSELTDSVEQRRRLLAEREARAAAGKPVFDIDEEFIAAVGAMPASAGMALGVDRLAQALTGCQNIDDVITLPASKLFSS